MPEIEEFEFVRCGEGRQLRVSISCADAGEAMSVLGRVQAVVGAVPTRTSEVISDPAYAGGERIAIEEEEPFGPDDLHNVEQAPRSLTRVPTDPPAEEPRETGDLQVPPKPGLDPADALAEYDAQSAEPEGGQAPFEGYSKGGRYDGVEIVRVQRSRAKGFGVLTLVDGMGVKYDLETGHTIETKNKPPLPDGRSTMDIQQEPTSRQSGVMAPDTDPPASDSHGTPLEEVPAWLAPVVEAKTLKAAVEAAVRRIDPSTLPDWAVSMREKVPAFGRVAEEKLKARVERQLLSITAKDSDA